MRSAARRGDPRFPYLGVEESFAFPDPRGASPEGVLCTGGNLSPGMLLSAYRQGIFPWFNEGDPIVWWSPNPRFVLIPEEIHCSKSMEKSFRKGRFLLSIDTDFRSVITACSKVPRPGQRGTWITSDMVDAYCELNRLGYAHSAEAYCDGRLVGGLYGVSLGSVFFGESMFSLRDDASKTAFLALAWRLIDEGFTLIDSQVHTDHLASLGAREIPREAYLAKLAEGLAGKHLRGNWGTILRGFPDSRAYRACLGERGSHAP